MPSSDLDADATEPDEVSVLLAESLDESAYEIERDSQELKIEDPWEATVEEHDE